MKLRPLFILALAALFATLFRVQAQPTNAAPPVSPLLSVQDQINSIVQRVQAKANAGKTSEADFADELKSLDDLLAAQKGAKTEDAATILRMKGQLYLEVFKDYQKCLQILKQVAADYPDTKMGAETATTVNGLSRELESKDIQDNLVAGSKFQDFDEKDLNGKPLSAGIYKGKVVLVDFWATWCPPCRAELPEIISIYKKYHPAGLEIVGISLDVARPDLAKFLASTPGMAWPQYFDTEIEKRAAINPAPGLQFDNKLAVKYGIMKIPFNILIAPNGRVIAKDVHGKELENTIKAALENHD